MGGVKAERRQHGQQLAKKIILYPVFLRRIPLTPAQEADAFGCQLWQQLLIQHLVLARDQSLRFLRDEPKDLRKWQTIRPLGRVCSNLLLEPGYSDLEEFIHVAVDYAQEAQPFERRNIAVFGERQNASVEFELTELAVQVQIRRDVTLWHRAIFVSSAEGRRVHIIMRPLV